MTPMSATPPPAMSCFMPGVVVSVAFQQVDGSPNAEAGTEGDDEGLENADSRVEKFHICVAGIIGCWWC